VAFHFVTLTLPAADRPDHADRSLRTYPVRGLPIPLLRGSRTRSGEVLPGGPGRPLAGDRAPARGVDVKPSPGEGSRAPSGGLGGPPDRFPDPGGVLGTMGPGGPRDPGDSPSREGGFTSTPRAGALSPAGAARSCPDPSGVPDTQIPPFGDFGQKRPFWGLPGLPRDQVRNTSFLQVQGLAARG